MVRIALIVLGVLLLAGPLRRPILSVWWAIVPYGAAGIIGYVIVLDFRTFYSLCGIG